MTQRGLSQVYGAVFVESGLSPGLTITGKQMPTYEYECQSCLHTFEEFQSITASPLSKCPKCNGPLRRLMGTGGAIIFKGSGFYATDYRSKGYKKKAREESKSGEVEKKKKTGE